MTQEEPGAGLDELQSTLGGVDASGSKDGEPRKGAGNGGNGTKSDWATE